MELSGDQKSGDLSDKRQLSTNSASESDCVFTRWEGALEITAEDGLFFFSDTGAS